MLLFLFGLSLNLDILDMCESPLTFPDNLRKLSDKFTIQQQVILDGLTNSRVLFRKNGVQIAKKPQSYYGILSLVLSNGSFGKKEKKKYRRKPRVDPSFYYFIPFPPLYVSSRDGGMAKQTIFAKRFTLLFADFYIAFIYFYQMYIQ